MYISINPCKTKQKTKNSLSLPQIEQIRRRNCQTLHLSGKALFFGQAKN
ncbi:hypothetical protein TFKS16_0381 [Tannerella forsythia KS16]|uniref:Uncharacterized protein n=1 Tax=Tannerella forsythia (strain ATCC 43037 / JCM 10827 / CCUG 21028 A / KCTC 5666 / FDC 338) TaxID=203275 RepID=G8ULW0_TANFA|nr:hypothetical protein BFO_0560 [Tannerella forsythia 92A2]BAR48104.1 hypothetical protein TF3313_0522 [Tannerella forsythia 3313]BAR50695.1 hypothetical protein TFKS16_0381 [Tannerella forsythia KS16]